MFEKEIKFIYDFSINEVRRLGSFFTYEELSSVDLHPAILKYISAELDYLIYEDRYKLLSNSNFDYSGSRIAEYFTLIGEEIKKSKRFSFDYVDNLILHAISFNVNFLAQPKWALTKLIFEKEDVVKTSELRQIINYIYFHEYIKAIIEKYLLKKNLQMISRAEFETILDKLDQEILAGDSSKVFNLVLHSIGEFFNIGSVLKSKIPLTPFKLYLKEKKMQGYVVRLESSFKGDLRQSFDIVEVQNVLFPAEVKKAPEQKPAAQKTHGKKPAEVKPADLKPVEQKQNRQKPAEQKPEEQKPEILKPEPQNRENYLDRIVKQEKPASFFSFGKSKESEPENEEHEKEKETFEPAESPEEKESPSGLDNKVSEQETDFDTLLNDDTPETRETLEPESVEMEFSEEEKTFDELEFEVVEEAAEENIPVENISEEKVPEEIVTEEIVPEKIIPEEIVPEANASEEEEAEEKENIFSGINIDNIDLDNIDSSSLLESDEAVESGNSGFLSRFLKKGSRNPGSRKTEEAVINKLGNEDPEPGINFDAEINIEEDAASEEIKEEENTAADSGIEGENNFSRVFAVISEVFSKREQQKIISEIFANRPEKFAGTVYNVITEARDVYDAQRLIDTVLRSNKIDLSSKWAKVFKKNIQQYFNQD